MILNKKMTTLVSIILGTCIIWRGVWGLMDVYFFPENKFVSYVLSILLGLLLLRLNNFSLEEKK